MQVLVVEEVNINFRFVPFIVGITVGIFFGILFSLMVIYAAM